MTFTRKITGLLSMLTALLLSACQTLQGTGDLGVVIERASGSVQIINTTQRTSLGRIEGLGDLSHASVVFSRDARYAYVFGRDGGLSKLDLLQQRITVPVFHVSLDKIRRR